MNKYILRTSLAWLAVIALSASAYYYLGHRDSHVTKSAELQPAAVGSATNTEPAAPNLTEAPLAPVQLTPDRLQSIGVQTAEVKMQQISDNIRATGTVEIDERSNTYVQVRFSGYVRKVFANATYQYVRKGDPLFTIYSPDLVTTQNEYLLARRNEIKMRTSSVEGVSADAAELTNAAEARLRQLNIPEAEIYRLKETSQPSSDILIDAPVSGYITERNALPNLYVEPATRLYSIADLSRVWVYAQVFQTDVARIKPNDSALITVDAYPDQRFRARIESILPQVDRATRTVRVRLEVSNPGLKLKPGMFVNADFKTAAGRWLMVPASAILQSGTRQLAFIDEGGGRLTPKDVVLGSAFSDQVVVLQGLIAGQRIVTSANFLIDSESQLQAAAGSYVPPPPGAGVVSAQPSLTIEFSSKPDPPKKGDNSFQVKVLDQNSKPLDGADISLTFFMPAMPDMGMEAIKSKQHLNPRGNGVYQAPGILPSGGPWQVTITVQNNGVVIGSKQLRVNATGGM